MINRILIEMLIFNKNSLVHYNNYFIYFGIYFEYLNLPIILNQIKNEDLKHLLRITYINCLGYGRIVIWI